MYILIVFIILVILRRVFNVNIRKLMGKAGEYICPKVAPADNNAFNKFNMLLDKINEFTTIIWNNIACNYVKTKCIQLTIILVLFGLFLDLINKLLNSLFKFTITFYGDFVYWIAIGAVSITYLYSVAIALLTFSDSNLKKSCDIKTKMLKITLTLIKYILIYLLPLIIIVSLLFSVSNATGTKEDIDGCDVKTNIGIPDNIQNYMIYFLFISFIIAYIYFDFLNCEINSNINKGISLIASLFTISLIIVGNFFLVNFISNSYTTALTSNFGLTKPIYWMMFLLSVALYYIMLKRKDDFEKIINFTVENIEMLLPNCNNTNNGNKEEMPPSINKPSINKPSININKLSINRPSINIKKPTIKKPINPKTKIFM